MDEVKKFSYYGVIDVPYYEVVKKINGIIFRKYFIIDIRNLDRYKVIFDNFNDFQEEFFDKEYWQKSNGVFSYNNNMMLYFLCDKDKRYDIDKYSILNNFEYAVKDFITENDMDSIIKNEGNFSLDDKEIIVPGKDKDIVLNRFNLITGRNGSGKTMMLREIANYYEAPIFNIGFSSINLDCGKQIGGDNLEKYLKMFDMKSSDSSIKSSTDKYFYELSQIMDCYSSCDSPLLLDNLRFSSLSVRNQVKLIDILFEYSNNHDVVITDCRNNSKKLVKNRVYKSNIIEL